MCEITDSKIRAVSRKALIVMAKRPFPGQTKTRLAPPFSPEQAAELYTCFLQDTLELVRSTDGITPFIAYSPVDQKTVEYFQELAPDFKLIPQIGPTLGERLDFVLSTCLAKGFDQVAAMNSDSPALPADYLRKAFENLDQSAVDVVLGPCVDGGYYLIGWKRPHPRLVVDVQMSTERVLADTLHIAKEEKLKVSLLDPWYDVDDLGDINRLQKDLLLNVAQADHTRRFFEEKAHMEFSTGI